MKFENRHLLSGPGRIWSRDRSKSVNVFYVFDTAETYAGGDRSPVRTPDLIDIKELDYRGKDRSKKIEQPEWLREEWLRGETTLETENHGSFRIRYEGAGIWEVYPIKDSDDN